MADYRKIRAVEEKSWLQSFPEEVYNLSDTSHLVRLAEALCGDPGVGAARKYLMIKRLQTALPETRYSDLDLVYSGVFGFPRLEAEKYSWARTDLLTTEQRHEMDIKDAYYRKRIYKYMRAFQYGGTRAGLRLLAESVFCVRCDIVSMTEYRNALGLNNGDTSAQYIGEYPDGMIDNKEFIVIVYRESPITEEESYIAHQVSYRLMPADTIISFKTVDEVEHVLGMHDLSYEDIPVKSIESSTDYWSIHKSVTGRMDWDYIKYPHLWIEPGVTKESPLQASVYSQEEIFDVTHMVNNVRASSEHVGFYNKYQAKYFPYLNKDDADALMVAQNAIASASHRRYIASFYGGYDAVDWSYPTAYTPEAEEYFKESSRAYRYWSSDELESGTEWIEFDLQRIVPLSCIRLDICQKPVKITPYVASALDENGNPAWCRILSRDGLPMSYTSRKWGGSHLSGNADTIEFSFQAVRADMVRIEFERIDHSYLETIADNTYLENSFPYSIEVSNISVLHEVRYKEDFIPSTYQDPYGNRMDTKLYEYGPNLAVDDDQTSYWMSQPNIGEEAIEYLILDVSDENDEPVRFNTIDILPVFGGCQVNIYSATSEGFWQPYPGYYELNGDRIELPTRNARWIKLEFTRLCAIPYQIVFSDLPIKTRLYDQLLRQHIEKESSSTYSLNDNDMLLYVPESGYSTIDIYGDNGVAEVYTDIEYATSSPLEATTQQFRSGGLVTNDQWRRLQDSPIKSIYGYSSKTESALSLSRLSTIAEHNPRFDYKFFKDGEHIYQERWDERTFNLAYVVAVRDIKVGFSAHSLNIGHSTDSFIVSMHDGRFIEDVDGWSLYNGERMRVDTDSYMCTMEITPLQSVLPFRTFDFAVNQNPPRNIFDYPSNMIKEWHSYGAADIRSTDFGVSGTVLGATLGRGDGGIESEPKLLRALGIATFEVDVFDRGEAKWIIECADLDNETVFSMSYDTEKGRWNKLGATFSPQPGGSWWNGSYAYRMRIPIAGPITKDSAIFFPCIDYDALRATATQRDPLCPSESLYPGEEIYPLSEYDDSGVVRGDLNDLRIIYNNGISNKELPVDITDNMEWWFRAQEDIATGVEADGRWHQELNRYVGAYYLYFGNKNEQQAIETGYENVFSERIGQYKDAQSSHTGKGMVFDNYESAFDIQDYRFSGGSGFITLEYEPDKEFLEVSGEGIPEIRFLLDYKDEDRRIQLYVYEKQLTFVIVDGRYESAFVSKRTDIFTPGKKSYIMCVWDLPGSASVSKNSVISSKRMSQAEMDRMMDAGLLPYGTVEAYSLEETVESDPSIRNRRKIDVYVDSAEALECIDNVYDEIRYNEGVY